MITDAMKLDGISIVTLMTIDFSTCVSFTPTGTTTFRLSANRNGTSDIVYDGNTYNYVGFEASGFRSEINGGPPSPSLVFDKASLQSLTAYNTLVDQFIVQTNSYFFDPRGAKVTILRTSNLSTSQQLNTQEYVVSQAVRESDNSIEWQLAIGLGIDRASGQSIASLAVNRCNLRYRRWNSTTGDFDYTAEDAGGCPYGNPTTVSDWSAVTNFGTKYFTEADAELLAANKNLDKCSHTAKGCQLRFDPDLTGLPLPFVMLYSPNTIGK